MKTITKTYNIYEFDELPQDIRNRVIEREAENIREAEVEDCLKEEMELYAQQLLKDYFGEKAIFKNVYYDLSYCQGSGAMIEFDLKCYNKNVKIRHNGGHYYHENSFKIVEVDFDDELKRKQYRTLKEKIYDINKELEKFGYDFIEKDRTNAAFEQLKDCLFYENGEIYNGGDLLWEKK